MKIILTVILLLFFVNPTYAWFWNKKEKNTLILSSIDPRKTVSFDEKLVNQDVFKVNSRIYFLIYTPSGFKSDYIKYQIVKQDDKAHVGGYSRIRNRTQRVSDKNYYIDYFILTEKGKYTLQIFDIENVHHWIAIGNFLVVDE